MTRRKKSRKEQRVMRYFPYCVEIIDWDMSYSLSLNDLKEFQPGPYWENLGLNFSGKFLYPKKLRDKDLTVSIKGNRIMAIILNDPVRYDDSKPKGIGGLTVRGSKREFLGFLPLDVFSFITSMLAERKCKYLILRGQELYQGSADIHLINFSRDFNEEEWE